MPSHQCFRVLFVVRPGPSVAACTRYRGYNVMEALRQAGAEVDHLDDRQIPETARGVAPFRPVVLVRRRCPRRSPCLLDFAERHSIPVVCDLDDYLFDDEVIPHSDYLRAMEPEQARELIGELQRARAPSGLLHRCTEYLRDRAASLGKASYLDPERTQPSTGRTVPAGRPEGAAASGRRMVRIGYFSGTLTHQSDFRTDRVRRSSGSSMEFPGLRC